MGLSVRLRTSLLSENEHLPLSGTILAAWHGLCFSSGGNFKDRT
ncbi:hypothetical protein HMPREF9446_00790 [Bacteroides fluxus YIT 12057]|uniref:Uncharacterized protein n=1 Tax=Bacteroides fluxus YIT 12057 TaxID=763034 RepID=F3PPZ8_9BACE|nr:hypothetical protein HMPREF9446_00790 [Bacteroides fluxus YIT 12057]